MFDPTPAQIKQGYEIAATFISTKPHAVTGCTCPLCTFILKWKEIHHP